MSGDHLARMDITIHGALVYDGTGSPPQEFDVHIQGDRIRIGGVSNNGAIVVDASGLAVAPGFIDCHTHDDAAALRSPLMSFKTTQGVTSVVVGNCGTSIAPHSGMVPGIQDFARFDDYFSALDHTPPSVNVATLVGHGAIRSSVMGLTNSSEASRTEMNRMLYLVAEAMGDGAIGLSSGLEYEPGRYVSEDELVELMQPVSAVGGMYATHMRNSADHVLESVAESISIGERAGARVQISHLKSTGERNYGKVRDALAMMRDARSRGVDVMTDVYPYTRGSTMLEQVLGRGDLHGGSDARFGGDDVLIATAPHHPEWEGLTLTQIGTPIGLDAVATAQMITNECGRSCIAILSSMQEDDVRTVLADPLCLVGSDGIPTAGKPHPRLHHTFTRVLGHYSRDFPVASLSDLIHRMTGLSAERFGFWNRGFIADGYFADLVLFDPNHVRDTGDYVNPTTPPDGIKAVYVNGVLTAEEGRSTGARAGRSVRWNR
jgi:N-acyl-D-amino-acid deacylase